MWVCGVGGLCTHTHSHARGGCLENSFRLISEVTFFSKLFSDLLTRTLGTLYSLQCTFTAREPSVQNTGRQRLLSAGLWWLDARASIFILMS